MNKKKILIIAVAVAVVALIAWLVFRWSQKNNADKLVEYVSRKQKLSSEQKQSLVNEVKRLSDKMASNPELLSEYQAAAKARNMTLAQYVVWSAAFNLFNGDVSDSIGLILGRM